MRSISSDAELQEPPELADRHIPVVCLLGKTGSGKSSIVKALTNQANIEIGRGFRPCTTVPQYHDFPSDKPVLRFLDTPGLGAVGYDFSEEIAKIKQNSHVLLACASIDDPAQRVLYDTICEICRHSKAIPVIAVYTNPESIPIRNERVRARQGIHARLEDMAGRNVPWVELDLRVTPGQQYECPAAINDLYMMLEDRCPEVAVILSKDQLRTDESNAFSEVRGDVLRYSLAAGTADAFPVFGLTAVPITQARMLYMLFRAYDIEMTRERFAAFAGALGAGIAANVAAKFVARQAVKLIPIAGQTVGAAGTAAASFATTFAIGRSAALFLFKLKEGGKVDPAEVQRMFKIAFKDAFKSRDV